MIKQNKGTFVNFLLILVSVIFVFAVIALPVIVVIKEAFAGGVLQYLMNISNSETIAAIKLTFFVAAVVVPMNTLFGVLAAWSITKFEFVGKSLLITIIELPFSVSPVIAGLIYVISFGGNSVLGKWLISHDIHVIFATPGIIIATIFVTFPLVARELIPLMQSQGTQEEEAAILLGASGFQTFLKVTMPNIKWGLLHGVFLCNARAIGEFGAVSVVSGHIIGLTNTMPLHIENLYNEYNFVGAFAVASLLIALVFLTVVIKRISENKTGKSSILI